MIGEKVMVGVVATCGWVQEGPAKSTVVVFIADCQSPLLHSSTF